MVAGGAGKPGANVAGVLVVSILLATSDFALRVVSADQIFTTSGVPFGRSSREANYEVLFHSIDAPFDPEHGQDAVAITSHEGRKYECFLPVEETKSMKSVSSHNESNIIIENKRRPKQPDELLDMLQGRCFYRHEGWWSYEFCYHGTVRQIHLDGEKVVQEFVLGVFDPEATAAYHQQQSEESLQPDSRPSNGRQRYHVHKYTNGTVCDLTDQPRETEVRFFCSEPTVLISSIKEISSCKYVATWQTPMLCKNPMFQLEKPRLPIHCNALPAETEGAVEDSAAEDTPGSDVSALSGVLEEVESELEELAST